MEVMISSKTWKWTLGVLALGIVLGLQFQHVVGGVDAAPSDIRGSDNMAVDTYRNSAGTYVVWSSGRITDVRSPSTDLGQPFTAPSVSSGIVDPGYQSGQTLGSPNVAVKAIPREDGTYILFADGTLRVPSDSGARAPSAIPGKILRGSVSSAGSSTGGSGFTCSRTAPGTYTVTFDTPFDQTPSLTVFCEESNQAGLHLVLPIQHGISANSFTIETHTWAGSVWQLRDESFDFMVAGE